MQKCYTIIAYMGGKSVHLINMHRKYTEKRERKYDREREGKRKCYRIIQYVNTKYNQLIQTCYQTMHCEGNLSVGIILQNNL